MKIVIVKAGQKREILVGISPEENQMLKREYMGGLREMTNQMRNSIETPSPLPPPPL